MGERPKKTTRVSISLEPNHYNDLTQIAEGSDASLAWVIRRAIAEFLDKQNQLRAGACTFRLQGQQAKR